MGNQKKNIKLGKPSGYWKNEENRKELFYDFVKEKNIQKEKDWYKINQFSFNDSIRQMLNKYEGNYIHWIIKNEKRFPVYVWGFYKAPRGFWKEAKNIRKYFDWIGKNENWKFPNDYYQITKELLRSKYKGSLQPQGHISSVTAPRP